MSCAVFLRRCITAGLFALIIPQTVNAAVVPVPVPGSEGFQVLVNSTDPIIATYQGTTAAFSSDLYWFVAGDSPSFILNNQDKEAISVGDRFILGIFPIGTELIFQIHVNDQNQYYFSGSASRNPDGLPHARVQSNWQNGETLVGFEDLFAQNNPNFHDLSFSISGTEGVNPVPVPASVQLFVLGLLMLVTRTQAI